MALVEKVVCICNVDSSVVALYFSAIDCRLSCKTTNLPLAIKQPFPFQIQETLSNDPNVTQLVIQRLQQAYTLIYSSIDNP